MAVKMDTEHVPRATFHLEDPNLNENGVSDDESRTPFDQAPKGKSRFKVARVDFADEPHSSDTHPVTDTLDNPQCSSRKDDTSNGPIQYGGSPETDESASSVTPLNAVKGGKGASGSTATRRKPRISVSSVLSDSPSTTDSIDPSNTVSYTDTQHLKTFGRNTLETLPHVDHYRNILSATGGIRKRPTLLELHDQDAVGLFFTFYVLFTNGSFHVASLDYS